MSDNKVISNLPLRKIVKQKNHDGGVIPESIREYAENPLYILIALWCCHQKKWIDRDQISDAFAITPRRASFQITYILRRCHLIQSSSRKVRAPLTRYLRQEIRIYHVDLQRVAVRKNASRPRIIRKSYFSPELRAGWRWVLTRQLLYK